MKINLKTSPPSFSFPRLLRCFLNQVAIHRWLAQLDAARHGNSFVHGVPFQPPTPPSSPYTQKLQHFSNAPNFTLRVLRSLHREQYF